MNDTPVGNIDLQFLKLGGSVITDKSQPHTARADTLARLAAEIAEVFTELPKMQLVLGHGSGSFGHVPAHQYGTRDGVDTPEGWKGFARVWQEAAELNRLVLKALHAAGLPAIVFPASACAITEDGRVISWDLSPLRAALANGMLPVVYGDVVFDRQRGGTILSTEEIFEYLAPTLRPQRILLAGIEPGVWADYPACTRLLEVIDTAAILEVGGGLSGAQVVDVTGGMASKVMDSRRLVSRLPGLEVRIFSGEIPGSVRAGLLGSAIGTLISG